MKWATSATYSFFRRKPAGCLGWFRLVSTNEDFKKATPHSVTSVNEGDDVSIPFKWNLFLNLTLVRPRRVHESFSRGRSWNDRFRNEIWTPVRSSVNEKIEIFSALRTQSTTQRLTPHRASNSLKVWELKAVWIVSSKPQGVLRRKQSPSIPVVWGQIVVKERSHHGIRKDHFRFSTPCCN